MTAPSSKPSQEAHCVTCGQPIQKPPHKGAAFPPIIPLQEELDEILTDYLDEVDFLLEYPDKANDDFERPLREAKSAIDSYIDKHYVTKEFWNESIKKQAAHHNSLTLKQVLGVIGEPTHKYCDAWEHGPSCQAEIAEDKLKDKLRQSAERIWS